MSFSRFFFQGIALFIYQGISLEIYPGITLKIAPKFFVGTHLEYYSTGILRASLSRRFSNISPGFFGYNSQ